MYYFNMYFLYPVCVALISDIYINIRQFQQLATIAAGEADHCHFFIFGCLSCVQDVLGVSATANDKHSIAFISQAFYIPGEDTIKSEIITYAGQMTGVGYGNGRQCSSSRSTAAPSRRS